MYLALMSLLVRTAIVLIDSGGSSPRDRPLCFGSGTIHQARSGRSRSSSEQHRWNLGLFVERLCRWLRPFLGHCSRLSELLLSSQRRFGVGRRPSGRFEKGRILWEQGAVTENKESRSEKEVLMVT